MKSEERRVKNTNDKANEFLVFHCKHLIWREDDKETQDNGDARLGIHQQGCSRQGIQDGKACQAGR